jgi:cell division protein FtsB
MLKKIKIAYGDPRVQQLRDVRVVGLIVFAIIVLLVTWSSVSVIQTNYVLQKQITQLDEQNRIQQLENDNQKLRNQYFNTDQYLELQARRQFGKAAPGETLVIIPKDVALSKLQPIPEANEDTTQQPNKPTYQKNFEAWRDFFLHRS